MRGATRERMIRIMAEAGLAAIMFSACLDKLTLVLLQTRARRMTKWKSKKATRRLTVSEFITRLVEPRVRHIHLLCCFTSAEAR
ncbi:hypothetical protein HDF12_003863 [Edaphobacter lichenicola]|uniref:Uncharacterized protein n=1 Tax=Tunturiibacter lichenicola TaxID=2051959 RepID=A0A7Y9NQ27_9BACT|nr:hypothetical protein [Edaphobacter lichenicola]